MVNLRRKNINSSAGAGIKFNGDVYRDQQELTEQWAINFQDLYTPTENPEYDNQW
jgi:hypothetical protein